MDRRRALGGRGFSSEACVRRKPVMGLAQGRASQAKGSAGANTLSGEHAWPGPCASLEHVLLCSPVTQGCCLSCKGSKGPTSFPEWPHTPQELCILMSRLYNASEFSWLPRKAAVGTASPTASFPFATARVFSVSSEGRAC